MLPSKMLSGTKLGKHQIGECCLAPNWAGNVAWHQIGRAPNWAHQIGGFICESHANWGGLAPNWGAAVFEGPLELVQKAVKLCHTGPASARVDQVVVKDQSNERDLNGFMIRH